MLVAGRVISGLCIGLTASLIPTYESEIAPHKIRGRIYGCSFINSAAAYRVPWAIQAGPAVILSVGLFWFPRSP
ncbi:hypothetical protein V1508DRAFT_424779, partial [Lipomyces doorenjongii]|uniref:uncharacterized protein n=1 Tax=Lipomyces doorenjongii TaxID=383834 RepID=UPI0034CDAAA3